MTVTFCSCQDDPLTVDKNLKEVYTATCQQYEQTEPLSCALIMSKFDNFSNVNYAYIDITGRYYYFSKPPDLLPGGLIRINLREDVLYTFREGIRQLTGTVDRQENLYNGYIVDGEYKALGYKQITTKAFPKSLDSDTTYIMTVG